MKPMPFTPKNITATIGLAERLTGRTVHFLRTVECGDEYTKKRNESELTRLTEYLETTERPLDNPANVRLLLLSLMHQQGIGLMVQSTAGNELMYITSQNSLRPAPSYASVKEYTPVIVSSWATSADRVERGRHLHKDV